MTNAHPPITRNAFLKGASLTTLAGILAACSTGSNDSASSSSSPAVSAESGAFPVTIKSEFGETKIESVPTKIAVVQAWKNADALLSFGVVPAGIPNVSWGENSNKSTDWFDDKLKALGKSLEDITRYDESNNGPNYDALAKLGPDVIFTPYGQMDQETYDKLTKIAPVVTAPEGDKSYEASWQHVVEQAGKMLGRPQEAKKIITDTEKTVKDAAAKYTELADATFIAGYFDVEKKTLGAYTAKDSRPQAFVDFGMKEAPYVSEHSKDASSVFLDISSEELDKVECDALWAWVNDPADVDKIKNDSLFSQMPAVKNNATVFASNKQIGLALSAASTLSLPWVLEKTTLLEELEVAVNNTKNAK
ncbi:MAG: ABC transporter substrate-binding protein [Rothia sp. (in: high G+C Gram-positive bacteria)]|uniref:ABC transporter substrate-binding protein n=1 Tax=Rothia sp. (in: high G+C Gram-positive bacteria) TaxID=1885016 RepID=UPI0026DD09C2|nr:ABC transporter substrate-binding protein [Rothia sp. (in: high G+C Gram-positive bacteria)]MDO4885049.1 ABC transporter substrate-binding protein [Rothia sp. (in: high G+C Gram-positive bacteria)]